MGWWSNQWDILLSMETLHSSHPPQSSLCTFNGLKRALHWFWLGSFIFCQLFCFHKDPSVGQHLLLELPWAAQWTQSIGQCTIKVGRSVLWRVLGGTDEAGVNLQGLTSLSTTSRLLYFFLSVWALRDREILCGCVEKVAAAGSRRSDQIAEPMRMWRNTT